jgi:hypothetical protein
MKNLSNPYSKLTESMKSSDRKEIFEDKDEREKRREERRKKRLEKGFGDKEQGGEDDEFNLKSFKKAVDELRGQSYAQEDDCALQIKLNGPGKKSAEENASKFRSISQRCSKLLGEIAYRINKEGKRLESTDEDDMTLIKSYRETYNDLVEDLKETIKSYNKQSADSVKGFFDNQKFKDIAGKVEEADAKFKKGINELIDKTTDIQLEYGQGLSVLSPKAAPAGAAAPAGTADTGATDIKIKEPVKKGTGSKSNPDETVKKVQELINKKFKNDKEVTKTAEWEKFSKYGADGAFGNATGNLIILIKKKFNLPAKNSQITQEFIDKLMEIKESKFSGSLLSFEDFLSNRK